MKKYVVKLAETGKVVASGSSYECTKQLGIASVSSFHSLVSYCKSGRNQKYIVDVVEASKETEVS